MLRRIALRFTQAVPVILIVAILTFLLMHLLPGDPAVVIAGPEASPEAVDRIRHDLGLDRPIPEQLFVWLANIAHGDLGRSLVLNQSVLSAVAQRLPVTVSLTLVSLAITLPIGLALGVLAACWRNTWVDTLVMLLALIGVSVPGFWISILSVILFSVTLHWGTDLRLCAVRLGDRAMVRYIGATRRGAGAVPDRLSRAHDPFGDAGSA